MKKPLEEKFAELHDRINKTCKARFQADRRLRAHAGWSIWTITLTSIALILINLIGGMKLETRLSSDMVSVVQIMGAVFLLCYSLILSMKQYMVDAHKMHRCGLDLSKLRFNVHPFVEKPGDEDEFVDLSTQYATILDAHDNHEDIDHLVVKTKLDSYYDLDWKAKGRIYLRYYGQFWHYILVMVAEISIVLFMMWPNEGEHGGAHQSTARPESELLGEPQTSSVTSSSLPAVDE